MMRLMYKDEKSTVLEKLLPHADLLAAGLDPWTLPAHPAAEHSAVFLPDQEFRFLHEAAVIAYHGTLFASWYNCPDTELAGYTPIRGKRSEDGGKTWSKTEILAHDPTGKLLYCPPVYCICKDTLYLLCNSMVSADHIHSLDLYCYDESTAQFRWLRSDPVPFKLNTNAYLLPTGKFLLCGRVSEIDGFPSTPAVLLSNTEDIRDGWRAVKLQENHDLPDGSHFDHPEISAIVQGNHIFMFCRNDATNVPLLYKSPDCGETWQGPYSIDIPFTNSKIYSGTLSNGRNYVIGNIGRLSDRTRLAVFLSEPGKMQFTEGYFLQNGSDEKLALYPQNQWSYPCACEFDRKLGILYTMAAGTGKDHRRGAMFTAVPTERCYVR